ncbi:MAG TPA: hypothetical protein VNY52_08100 [Solirubrobacteraceae bacterium]|jgi:hypothetical protein|nr:hypothetical protein [Solirubrobacteraceae bacterium]
MRIVIAAALVAAVGLAAAGVLGVAGAAETTTAPAVTAPLRTVSVQGVASEPLSSEASAATATSVYRAAMAEAVNDGRTKAQFLAEKGGATLGQAQTLTEGGGYIECPGGVEYVGGQPDFGFATGYGLVAAQSAPVAAGRPVPFQGKRKQPVKRHTTRPAAKKSAGGTCMLSTQVAAVYQLS